MKSIPFIFHRLLGILLASAVLTSCGHEPEANVIVLHTGRLLGNVYPLSIKNGTPLQYYPYLAGYVKKVREEAARLKQQVVLVDLGDGLRGSFAAQATDSANMIELFKSLEYDAIILGNLDDNVRPETIRHLAPIPVLCPFETMQGTSAMPGTSAKTTLHKGSIEVDLVANFYGDASAEQFRDRFPSYYAANWQESIRPVRNYESLLSPAREGKITLLSWFKFEPAESSPAWLEPYQDRVDAILAHRIYPSSVRETWGAGTYPGWKIPISENILRQNRGFSISRLELKVEPGKTPKLIRQELIQLTSDTVVPDPEISRRMEKFAPVLQKADHVVGTLTAPWSRQDILQHGVSTLARVPGVNAVLYSAESIRAEWPKGELRSSRVYESLPWNNQIVKISLSGAQWEKLKSQTTLKWAELTQNESAPRIVATSTFQAASLCDRLGLPRVFQAVSDKNEFQFFLESLSSKNLITALPLPPQWKGNGETP